MIDIQDAIEVARNDSNDLAEFVVVKDSTGTINKLRERDACQVANGRLICRAVLDDFSAQV
jgi:hypothetical protein